MCPTVVSCTLAASTRRATLTHVRLGHFSRFGKAGISSNRHGPLVVVSSSCDHDPSKYNQKGKQFHDQMVDNNNASKILVLLCLKVSEDVPQAPARGWPINRAAIRKIAWQNSSPNWSKGEPPDGASRREESWAARIGVALL